MLFIVYSSAFNTIVTSKLITKLRILALNTSLCNWILNFLTVRPQAVMVGNYTSTVQSMVSISQKRPHLFTLRRLKRFVIGPQLLKSSKAAPLRGS
jgi:hypothetical protein